MDLLIALALARGFESAAASAGNGRRRLHPAARRRRTLYLRSGASAARRTCQKLGDPAQVTP